VASVARRPSAGPLARAQLAAGRHELATAQHKALALDPFARRLLGLLDGTRTVEDVTTQLLAEVADGRLAVEGIATGRVGALVEGNVRRLLTVFAGAGLLQGDSASH
jgi:hypothetical protein